MKELKNRHQYRTEYSFFLMLFYICQSEIFVRILYARNDERRLKLNVSKVAYIYIQELALLLSIVLR